MVRSRAVFPRTKRGRSPSVSPPRSNLEHFINKRVVIVTSTPLRVASLTLDASRPANNALRRLLVECAAAEQRAQDLLLGRGDNQYHSSWTAALKTLTVKTGHMAPLDLHRVIRDHPRLFHALRELIIEPPGYNYHSVKSMKGVDKADLGALVATAPNLLVLKLALCGAETLPGLSGRCKLLRRLTLSGLRSDLSLEGLANHDFLQELELSRVSIASLEPLRTCPTLTKVVLRSCRKLSSLDGLQNHQMLQEIRIVTTSIKSLAPLRTCPALTKVEIFHSSRLFSLKGLEGHQFLALIDITDTPIKSLDPLGTCPALKKVVVRGPEDEYSSSKQQRLSSIKGLEDHQFLEEVNVSGTAITSLLPLRTCPALKDVRLYVCRKLASLAGLEGHAHLHRVSVSESGITSLEPLHTCPALKEAWFCGCKQLSSIAGLEGHAHLLRIRASETDITSIVPLRTCPALKEVSFGDCSSLTSIEGLQDHPALANVYMPRTAITCIEPLRTCPALYSVDFSNCKQLTSIAALEGHQFLKGVFVNGTAITSLVPLRSCPALSSVDIRDCVNLPADKENLFVDFRRIWRRQR